MESEPKNKMDNPIPRINPNNKIITDKGYVIENTSIIYYNILILV